MRFKKGCGAKKFYNHWRKLMNARFFLKEEFTFEIIALQLITGDPGLIEIKVNAGLLELNKTETLAGVNKASGLRSRCWNL